MYLYSCFLLIAFACKKNSHESKVTPKDEIQNELLRDIQLIKYHLFKKNIDSSNILYHQAKSKYAKNSIALKKLETVHFEINIEKNDWSNASELKNTIEQNTDNTEFSSYFKAQNLYVLGKYFLKTDSIKQAQKMFEKALLLCDNNDSTTQVLRGLILHNIGVGFDVSNDITNAEIQYRKALEILQNYTGKNDLTKINTLHNLAEILRYRGALTEAEKLLNEALRLSKINNASPKQYYLLQLALSANYRSMGKFEFAIVKYKQLVHYFNETNDVENKIRAEIGLTISLINAHHIIESEAQLQHLKQTIFKSGNKQFNEKVNEIEAYLLQEKHEYANANAILIQQTKLSPKNNAITYGEMAYNALQSGDSATAKQYVNESNKAFYRNEKAPNETMLTTLFTQMLLSKNENEIIDFYNKALQVSISDTSDFTQSSIVNPVGYLQTKETYFTWLLKNNKQSDFIDFDNEIELLHALQNNFNDELELTDFTSIAEKYIDKSIQLLYNQYAISNNENMVLQMLKFNEVRKALLLRNEINKKANLSTKEADQLQKLQMQKFELKQLPQNDSTKKVVANIQREIENIEKNTRENNMFDLLKFKNIGIFKSFIPHDVSIVSYIRIDSILLSIVSASNQLKCVKTHVNTDISAWAQQLKSSDFNTFSNASFRLFNLYIRAIENDWKKTVIIIPDGQTRAIPFECLIRNNKDKGFKKADYLLYHHALAYNYSVHNYLFDYKVADNSSVVGFFAPINFSNKSPTLKGSIDELEAIRKHIQVNYFIKEECTAKNLFIKNNYPFAHIATHTYVNQLQPDFSYILLNNDSAKSTPFYVYQFNDFPINKSLIFLSTCANADGVEKKNEGNVSIARAFIQSGVHNIISTFWNISDATSVEISGGFYKYLTKNNTKEKSLQKTKIEFIKNNSETLSAPKFWASYHLISNYQPLKLHTGINSALYFLIICSITVLLFYMIKYAESKQKEK